MTFPHMWFDAGDNARICINVPAGPILDLPLSLAALTARVAEDHEVLRFTYELTDPETGDVTTGAARLAIAPLPDPREA